MARVFGGGDADALPAGDAPGAALRNLRGTSKLEFLAGLHISRLVEIDGRLAVHGSATEGRDQLIDSIDEIVCATGQRPDLTLTSIVQAGEAAAQAQLDRLRRLGEVAAR